jgi:hypothetical protein
MQKLNQCDAEAMISIKALHILPKVKAKNNHKNVQII